MFGRNKHTNYQSGYYQQNLIQPASQVNGYHPYGQYSNGPGYPVPHPGMTEQPFYGYPPEPSQNPWQSNQAYPSDFYYPSYQNNPHPNVLNQGQIPRPNASKNSQFLFQNPLQPKDDILHPYYQQQMNVQPNTNPYPNANPYPKQTPASKKNGGVQSIMNSFKSQDGSVDVNKMMNTAGQMMSAVNQVSSLVKGIGGMFKF